jgi:hypothetical protein
VVSGQIISRFFHLTNQQPGMLQHIPSYCRGSQSCKSVPGLPFLAFLGHNAVIQAAPICRAQFLPALSVPEGKEAFVICHRPE